MSHCNTDNFNYFLIREPLALHRWRLILHIYTTHSPGAAKLSLR